MQNGRSRRKKNVLRIGCQLLKALMTAESLKDDLNQQVPHVSPESHPLISCATALDMSIKQEPISVPRVMSQPKAGRYTQEGTSMIYILFVVMLRYEPECSRINHRASQSQTRD